MVHVTNYKTKSKFVNVMYRILWTHLNWKRCAVLLDVRKYKIGRRKVVQ